MEIAKIPRFLLLPPEAHLPAGNTDLYKQEDIRNMEEADVQGVPETMPQPLYARAVRSKSKRPEGINP